MSFFSLLLNILWIAFGGLWMAVAWIVAAVIMAITIIGLPWARAAINIGLYTLSRSARRPCRAQNIPVSKTLARGYLDSSAI